jgi:hypothetical protein
LKGERHRQRDGRYWLMKSTERFFFLSRKS